jgi:hypothetical protein
MRRREAARRRWPPGPKGRQPGVVGVAIVDLPPSETALAWLSATAGNKIEAFARTATDVRRARAGGAPHDAGRPLPPATVIRPAPNFSSTR